MKKVLVLNGSPKPVSDTMTLTRAFLKGLEEAGGYDIELLNVNKMNIKPCIGCFGCWRKGEGKCVLEDDQNAILEKYAAADVVVLSFPLYSYAMPSQLKAVLDRTIPLVQMKMVMKDGKVQHVPLVDFSHKRTVVISGCGFPDWEGNFDGLRIMCRNLFGLLTTVFVPETPLLNVPQARPLAQPLWDKFTEAGREYARENTLSAQTVAALETPIMPKEEYIKQVNAVL